MKHYKRLTRIVQNLRCREVGAGKGGGGAPQGSSLHTGKGVCVKGFGGNEEGRVSKKATQGYFKYADPE